MFISNGRWSYWLLLVVCLISMSMLRWAYVLQATWPDMPVTSNYLMIAPSMEPSPAPKLLCDVLVTAELESLVQEPLTGPESKIIHEQGVIQSQTCFWSAASGEYTPTISVNLRNAETIVPNEVVDDATLSAELSLPLMATDSTLISPPKTVWQREQARNRTRPGYQEIDNLGEEAYVNPTGLFVLAEGKMIRVFVSLADRTQAHPLMEQIARQVLTSLIK